MARRSPSEVARTVAQNFIRAHGKAKFARLVEMFQAQVPGPKIAFEFGVTRQRVHQWKNQLGIEKVEFTPHPEIQALLNPGSNRKTV